MILNSIKSDTNWGEAASAINDNFSKTNLEISKVSASSSKFKGFYTTEALLLTAIPSPIVGDNAWVGASYPGVVYVCNTSGTWTATATVPTPPAVDLTNYYDKVETDTIIDTVEANIASLETDLNEKIEMSQKIVTKMTKGLGEQVADTPVVFDSSFQYPNVMRGSAALSEPDYAYSNEGMWFDKDNPIDVLNINCAITGTINVLIVDITQPKVLFTKEITLSIVGLNKVNFSDIGWDWNQGWDVNGELNIINNRNGRLYVFFQTQSASMMFAIASMPEYGSQCYEFHLGMNLVYGMPYFIDVASIRGSGGVQKTSSKTLSIISALPDVNNLNTPDEGRNSYLYGNAMIRYAYCDRNMEIDVTGTRDWNLCVWNDSKLNKAKIIIASKTGVILHTISSLHLTYGWNVFNSILDQRLGVIQDNYPTENFYVFVQFLTPYGVKFRSSNSLNSNIQIDITTGVIQGSSAEFRMGIVRATDNINWEIIRNKNVNDNNLIPIPEKWKPNGRLLKNYNISSASAIYSYFINEYYITSQRRLRGVGFFANKEANVRIDFLFVDLTDPDGTLHINPNWDITLSYKAKKGWNYIPESQIKVPYFSNTYCYIGIRSDAGVLSWSRVAENEGAVEVNGSTNLGIRTIYAPVYFVDIYQYDIYQEIKNKRVIQLPQGNIDLDKPLSIVEKTLLGNGGNGDPSTVLTFNWAQGQPNIGVQLGHYGELRNVKLFGPNYNDYQKGSNYCNNLEEIQQLNGFDINASSFGVSMEGIGARVENVDIEGFGIGIYNSSQATRQVHYYMSNISIRNCFIGYNFLPAAEYGCISNLSASNCVIGIRAATGNLFFSSCSFNDNRVGLYYYKAGNDAHGSFAACNFNHNAVYSLVLDQISHGETFVGCHVFEGDIYLYRSIGFNFNGGTIDANILAQGGKTQLVQGTSFQNAYWNRNAGIGHNYNGETSYLRMVNNFFMFETGENDNIINNVVNP